MAIPFLNRSCGSCDFFTFRRVPQDSASNPSYVRPTFSSPSRKFRYAPSARKRLKARLGIDWFSPSCCT